MISLEEAEDLVDEIALAASLTEEDILSVRRRIPSENPAITPLLENLAATYFLTDEVLLHYRDKLYELANS